MRAIDTNVLIYAHRQDSPFHDPATTLMRSLSMGAAQWAIPWPCVYEFYSVATHPKIYSPPSTPEAAIDQLQAWIDAPSSVLIGEPLHHWNTLETVLRSGSVAGPLVHDARIAALCEAHGVDELVTLDRDFSRFPSIRTRSLLDL